MYSGSIADNSEEHTASFLRTKEKSKQAAARGLPPLLTAYLSFSSVLKMEAVESSEMSVNFYQTTMVSHPNI
jgi:hypothetical protein